MQTQVIIRVSGSETAAMNKQKTSINLVKLAFYILKRIWLVIICAAIGFGIIYYRASKEPDTYTASGTMFVTNSNPNLINYGYTSTTDISSAVQLVNIYSEVVRSETVMQRVLEYRIESAEEDGVDQDLLLSQKYPGLSTAYIRKVVSMFSVNETPMVRVSCTTTDPVLSADICNAVLQVAPTAIKDVVGAGDAKPQDFATVPMFANNRGDMRKGLIGGLAGAIVAIGLLALLFLMNRKVEDTEELTDNYTLPILATVRRCKGDEKDPGAFLLSEKSEMDLMESYAKLRMNLLYTLVGKEQHTILVTSAVSGEGKSTVAANLAISLAISGKRVLLMDADMRRACQGELFQYDLSIPGLSDVLIGDVRMEDVILTSERENLDVLPAGSAPPNPSELLESQAMQDLLKQLEAQYDMILLDAPPINIVSDPLALSTLAVGAVFVVRQHFSDHREIRKALIEAEMTGLELLGFVFYGEKIRQGGYYKRKTYKGYQYYYRYDTRPRAAESQAVQKQEETKTVSERATRGTEHDEDPGAESDEEMEINAPAKSEEDIGPNESKGAEKPIQRKTTVSVARPNVHSQSVRKRVGSGKPDAQPARIHGDSVRMERRRSVDRRDSIRSQRRSSR